MGNEFDIHGLFDYFLEELNPAPWWLIISTTWSREGLASRWKRIIYFFYHRIYIRMQRGVYDGVFELWKEKKGGGRP